MHWAIGAILACASAYLAFGLVIYLRQEHLIFHPSKEMLCDPSLAGMDFEQCRFKTSDGVELTGWLIPAKGGKPLCTILFCTGNAGNISFFLETASEFHSLNCDLLLFNYRSFGSSGGPFPTEEGVYLDAEAAWDFLTKTRGIPAERIAVVGRSLGGGAACELASHHKVSTLVLESTFKSIPAMASELYPIYPASLLARVKFDNFSKIAKLDCPTLIVHSFEDEIVPYRQGKELFKASVGNPKNFLSLSGPHNDCYFVSQTSYHAALGQFLRTQFP